MPARTLPWAEGEGAGDAARRGDRIMVAVYAVALVVFLIEGALLLLYRSVNQDEGWYLWAAKLVYEGKVLYRDFAFPQSPLLPYFYGPFQLLFGRGLYSGRILTLLLALPTLWLGARLAGKLALARGGEDAWRARILAEMSYLALGLSTIFAAAYAFAYTAPYALAALLLVLAFYVSYSEMPEGRRAALAMVFLALSTGVRLSVAPAFLPLGLYVVLKSRRRWRVALIAAGATLLTLAIIFGPFLVAGGSALPYDIFGFHTDRMPRDFQAESQRYSVRMTLRDFSVPLALGALGVVGLFVAAWRRRSLPKALGRYLPEIVAGIAWLSIFAGHLVPRTTNSFYNVLQFPLLMLVDAALLSAVVGVVLGPVTARPSDSGRTCTNENAASRARAIAAGLILALVCAVNMWIGWNSMLHVEVISWPLQNQVAAVRQAGRYLAQHVTPGRPLVTFNPQVALEAGLSVPPGFEMSVFGYQPTWSTERARAYRVINGEMLLRAIDEARGAVAFTEYDLRETLKSQGAAVEASLARSYRWTESIPGAGPVRDDLRIYLPPEYGPAAPALTGPEALADNINLQGYDLEAGPYRRGEPIRLALYWSAGAVPPQGSYTVFMHLLDADGKLVAGWDNPPCRRTCPTDTWRPGETIRDQYTLVLEKTHAPGTYTIETGMYDGQTGKRLPVQASASHPAGDRILLGEITIK